MFNSVDYDSTSSVESDSIGLELVTRVTIKYFYCKKIFQNGKQKETILLPLYFLPNSFTNVLPHSPGNLCFCLELFHFLISV